MSKQNELDLSFIIEELDSDHWAERIQGIEELNQLDPPEAFDLLISMLKDPHPDVVKHTIYILGQRKDPRAFEPLVQLLSHQDWMICEAALSTLADIGLLSLEPFLTALGDKDLQELAADILAEAGEKVVDPLLHLLNEPNTRKRIGAAMALSYVGNFKAIQPLLQLLLNKQEDSELRSWAAYALGQYNTKEVIESLTATLMDKSEATIVREKAVRALSLVKNEEVSSLLINTLSDEAEDVRAAATRSLSRIRSEQAQSLLIAALKDASANIREEAVLALGELKSPMVVEPLVELLKTEDNSSVLETVAETLGDLGDIRAIEPLIELLNRTKDAFVLERIIEVLGKLSDSSMIPFFVQELMSTDLYDPKKYNIINVLKKYVQEVVPILLPLLKDSDNNKRRQAVNALRELDDRRAIIPLIELLKDENPTVKLAAIEALGSLRDERALPGLLELQQSSEQLDDYTILLETTRAIRAIKIAQYRNRLN